MDFRGYHVFDHRWISRSIGLLGIILALVFKGNPVYVMPWCSGCTIVNTLVTAWMSGTLNKISPIFVTGIVAAALGAGGVLTFKPPAKLPTKSRILRRVPTSKIQKTKRSQHQHQLQLQHQHQYWERRRLRLQSQQRQRSLKNQSPPNQARRTKA